MNELERLIIEGTKAAQKEHIKMSGGYWLDDAAEAYLQIRVGQYINQQGKSLVAFEKSPNKMDKAVGDIRRGRPRGNEKKRFDLIVWRKAYNMAPVHAVLEIKRTWLKRPVKLDVQKIRRYVSQKGAQTKTGYVLWYTSRKKPETISSAIAKMAKTTGCKAAAEYVNKTPSKDDWYWGAGLFRVYTKRR